MTQVIEAVNNAQSIVDPFEDARLFHRRAVLHIHEFRNAIGANDPESFWSVTSEPAGDDEARYSLWLHLERLTRLQPVIGDIAHNLERALNYLARAAARLSLDEEELQQHSASIFFPFPDREGSIEFELGEQSTFLRTEFVKAILEVWDRHKPSLIHIRAIREISNGSRDWELEAADPSAHPVQLIVRGRPAIQVPVPHGHFERHESFEWRAANAMRIFFLLDIRLRMPRPKQSAQPEALDPDAVFDRTSNYVADMLEAFGAASRQTRSS